MSEPKPRPVCMDPAHINEPTTVQEGDWARCTVCGKERLSFQPADEDDTLDALMDRGTTEWPGPGRIVEVPASVCWMAYYTDMSGIAVFDNEIDCLRHAVSNHMEVIELQAGDVNDQINAKYRKG